MRELKHIAGRAEEIKIQADLNKYKTQNFKVIVDYAHTVDSLEKIYEAYPGKKIGVLGACGGGRDKAKQSLLGKVADNMCDVIVITDEDPYDDDVMTIINSVASGVKNKILDKNLFIEKVNYVHYPEGTRENIVSGVVKVKKALFQNSYLGVKNPDPTYGIHVAFEAVAITLEEELAADEKMASLAGDEHMRLAAE